VNEKEKLRVTQSESCWMTLNAFVMDSQIYLMKTKVNGIVNERLKGKESCMSLHR